MTGENGIPSEATQSPPKSGIDWMSICTTVQPALYPSCDTLVNSDGTLTPEGQHAVDCIKNGALLAGGAMTGLVQEFTFDSASLPVRKVGLKVSNLVRIEKRKPPEQKTLLDYI
jgi:hypothetical protein